MTDQGRADRALAMIGILEMRDMGIVWLPVEHIDDQRYRNELHELNARGVQPDYQAAAAITEPILAELEGFFTTNA